MGHLNFGNISRWFSLEGLINVFNKVLFAGNISRNNFQAAYQIDMITWHVIRLQDEYEKKIWILLKNTYSCSRV